MQNAARTPQFVDVALGHLGVECSAPRLDSLVELIDAFTRTVPWESASRIDKWRRTADLADCPRWPDEFWRDAVERGLGGTCFESNYAFYALLEALGYDGYLTINDMQDTVGCHTAMVLSIDGRRWLVDMGWPVFAAVQINRGRESRQPSAFHDYILRPEGTNRYRVERTKHPEPYCFTLIDKPVADEDYRAAQTADYGPGGFFLDKIVISKVIGEYQWRFNSAESPWSLQRFAEGQRTDQPLDQVGEAAALTLSRHFNIDEQVLASVLDARRPPSSDTATR